MDAVRHELSILASPLMQQPAATVVPLTVVACLALQRAAQQWAAGAYAGMKELRREEMAAKVSDAAVRVVGTLFAVCASSTAAWILLTCEPGLSGDFYATDARAEALFAVAAGYFVWDIYVCVSEGWGLAYIAHGVACGFVFLGGLHPFLMHMGCICLLYEASTVFMHLRRFAIDMRWARARPGIVAQLSQAFGAVFFVVRILIGMPASAVWWVKMLAHLEEGTAHSVPVFVAYLACNTLLCGLNLYWFGLVVRQGLKARAAPGKADDALSQVDEKSA